MCSYCGCESIEVIGRFMAEHVEIINATGDLRRAVVAGEPEPVAAACARVADLLWPHTTAEEGGLFRVLGRDEGFSEHIEKLCGEHRTLDDYLGEITPGDQVAMARFEDALRDHIDKEDNGLFPAAAIALDGPQWLEVHDSTPHSHAGDHSHGEHADGEHADGEHAHGQHHHDDAPSRGAEHSHPTGEAGTAGDRHDVASHRHEHAPTAPAPAH